MSRSLIVLLAAALLLPAAVAARVPAESGRPGIITVPLANVREEPLPKAKIVTQVLLADQVRILEKKEYRYRIAIPDQGNREGWIQQEAVRIPRDGGRSYYASGRAWIVITTPRTPAVMLDDQGNNTVSLYGGTRLPVLEREGNGYKVQLPYGSKAVIVFSDAAPVLFRDPLSPDVDPADIARTARRFRGIRYLDGGITEQGMDIRGLIYTVYRINGIDLDTEQTVLLERTVKVPKQDLRPGDIIEFSGEGLGLYLGGGQFLKAAKRGGVQVGGIHTRRYARSLRNGLRVVGADSDPKKRPSEMTAAEIMLGQGRVAALPLGKRIVFWAERFIGTPYDTDPLGLYVRTKRIVADEKADCMYLTFRAVELARSDTPGGAIDQALDLRFRDRGRLLDGLVQNYGDRFDYGEDMVFSGKWGRNITADLGPTETIPGSRGRDTVEILPKRTLLTAKFRKQLADGDIIYWVKDPKKRVVGEIVAHLSFIHIKEGRPFLIHASGTKTTGTHQGGGSVREVPFAEYARATKFIGAFVTRFEQ